MTTYSMAPISNGTRLRTDHNTFASVITSYAADSYVVGDDVWTAPADGTEVRKGDIWLHVTHVNNIPVANGWMAYIHKATAICDNFEQLPDTPPVDPAPVFPDSFILTDPSGAKAEYKFVRIVE